MGTRFDEVRGLTHRLESLCQGLVSAWPSLAVQDAETTSLAFLKHGMSRGRHVLHADFAVGMRMLFSFACVRVSVCACVCLLAWVCVCVCVVFVFVFVFVFVCVCLV